jgi:hypothetical protein
MRKSLSGILMIACLVSACGIGGRSKTGAETRPASSPAGGSSSVTASLPSYTAVRPNTPRIAPTGTPAHTLVPGIDSPVVVQGISLQISQAEKDSDYLSEPADSGRLYLYVYIAILDGKISMLDFSRWSMSLTDEKGEEYRQKGAFIHPGETPDSTCCAEWIYDIGEKDASFIFHFPEGPGIPLNSLLT